MIDFLQIEILTITILTFLTSLFLTSSFFKSQNKDSLIISILRFFNDDLG